HVRTEDHLAGIGEAQFRLLGDALAAGPAGNEAVDGAAIAASLGPPHLVAAMMTHQHAAEAVLDQPGVAIGALVLVAAGPAQGQRRVAATVEKEQRLLATIERREDFPGEPRGD